MQNESNVKRKKEEFNKVSGPLPNQQSSNRDEQQTKVMEIFGQLFISDLTSVSREYRQSFSDFRQRPGKVPFFPKLEGAVISPWDSIFSLSCISPVN